MKSYLVRLGLVSAVLMALSAVSFGQVAVGISVRIGPPALPVYAQPICPGPGYIWTPGYWAWDDDGGYYWVPGTWVVAPVGMYWTPGYWGWGGGFYLWHAGYWGPHVGFYGGINYGFGYGGVGFVGGEWRREGFYYNRSVTNVSVTNVTNVYNKTVIVNNNSTVSYNGGTGGIPARPSAQEESYARERHTAPLAVQSQHEHTAAQNRQNFAAENHGRPAIAATARPADFSSRSAVPARAAGGAYRAPAISPKEARVASNAHANPSPGNAGGRNTSNEGFRPFTPPSKNNSTSNGWRNNNAGGNNNRPYNGSSRPNNNPSYNGSNRPNNSQYNPVRPNQTRPNQNQPSPNRPQPNQSRPAPAQPREAPRANPRPSNPPSHQSAPREERPRGKGGR